VRYPPDHKARARDAMVAAGASAMKSCGFNGIGVDGLASAAGVTSGAFYSNFPNKEAMLEAVIDAGLGEPFLTETDPAHVEEGRAMLIDLLGRYIDVDHCANAADGCVMPTLSADVARAKPSAKETYERKMTAFVDRIAAMLDGDEEERRRRAWSVVAIMVGSVVISRGMTDGGVFRDAALASALTTALALIGADGPEPGR
jgi:TetR/AcrR family transcriptional regulator, transcriptional repressor for nem operon